MRCLISVLSACRNSREHRARAWARAPSLLPLSEA